MPWPDKWEDRTSSRFIATEDDDRETNIDIYCHPWLSMHIQGLLLNEKESLIPNDCHCGETNSTGNDPNILVSTRT